MKGRKVRLYILYYNVIIIYTLYSTEQQTVAGPDSRLQVGDVKGAWKREMESAGTAGHENASCTSWRNHTAPTVTIATLCVHSAHKLFKKLSNL